MAQSWFDMVAFFALTHAFVLVGILTFLLGVEFYILFTIISILTSLSVIYYSAYFASRGWKR